MHRRAGKAQAAHRTHVGACKAGVGQQVVVKRRYQVEVGDALLRDAA